MWKFNFEELKWTKKSLKIDKFTVKSIHRNFWNLSLQIFKKIQWLLYTKQEYLIIIFKDINKTQRLNNLSSVLPWLFPRADPTWVTLYYTPFPPYSHLGHSLWHHVPITCSELLRRDHKKQPLTMKLLLGGWL